MPTNKGWCYHKHKGVRCPHPAKYHVISLKNQSANRFLCGYHAKRFIKANDLERVTARLLGRNEVMPYRIRENWPLSKWQQSLWR